MPSTIKPRVRTATAAAGRLVGRCFSKPGNPGELQAESDAQTICDEENQPCARKSSESFGADAEITSNEPEFKLSELHFESFAELFDRASSTRSPSFGSTSGYHRISTQFSDSPSSPTSTNCFSEISLEPHKKQNRLDFESPTRPTPNNARRTSVARVDYPTRPLVPMKRLVRVTPQPSMSVDRSINPMPYYSDSPQYELVTVYVPAHDYRPI